VFLVSLERSWSVDIENGLALVIWTSVAQVMGKRRGRESNWQFDSRPLKVKNRPLSDLRIESAIRRWKDLDEGYKFGSDLVAIRLCSRELWAPKVPGLHPRLHPGQFRDKFRDSNPRVPGKSDIRAWVPRSVTEWIRWWLTPESGLWWVKWVQLPVACPNTQGCPRMWTNHMGGFFLCRFKLDLLVPLPSLILGLPTRPSTPF
jgi:hypothetical protein